MVGLGFSQRSATVVVATSQGYAIDHDTTQFQSQTRSRPGCHIAQVGTLPRYVLGFNLKREAAPVATQDEEDKDAEDRAVSISNEKPPRLPRRSALPVSLPVSSFNLKREAAPVATPKLKPW